MAKWTRPELKLKKKTEYERRPFTQEEYEKLVAALLNPPTERSRGIYREAADTVRMLRQTGGRLNEVLRLRLNQINYAKRTVHLEATKT